MYDDEQLEKEVGVALPFFVLCLFGSFFFFLEL
jgi:hypothetical protein